MWEDPREMIGRIKIEDVFEALAMLLSNTFNSIAE